MIAGNGNTGISSGSAKRARTTQKNTTSTLISELPSTTHPARSAVRVVDQPVDRFGPERLQPRHVSRLVRTDVAGWPQTLPPAGVPRLEARRGQPPELEARLEIKPGQILARQAQVLGPHLQPQVPSQPTSAVGNRVPLV